MAPWVYPFSVDTVLLQRITKIRTLFQQPMSLDFCLFGVFVSLIPFTKPANRFCWLVEATKNTGQAGPTFVNGLGSEARKEKTKRPPFHGPAGSSSDFK